jgi:hypothetical protein
MNRRLTAALLTLPLVATACGAAAGAPDAARVEATTTVLMTTTVAPVVPAAPVACVLTDKPGQPGVTLAWTVADGRCLDLQDGPVDTSRNGTQRVETDTKIDPNTGLSTLGLWLTDKATTGSQLLVSHGDALEVSEPTLSASAAGVYFIARHPDRYELHHYRFTDGGLDTVFESSLKISTLAIASPPAFPLVAMQLGACDATTPTDVAVVKAGQATYLSKQVADLAGKWLSPIGWMPERGLAVVARPSGCTGPADLWIIGAPTTNAQPTKVASGVTRALMSAPAAQEVPPPIELPLARQVVS